MGDREPIEQIERTYNYQEGKRLVQSTFDYFFEPDARIVTILETNIKDKTVNQLQLSQEQLLQRIKIGNYKLHDVFISPDRKRIGFRYSFKDGFLMVEYIYGVRNLGSFRISKGCDDNYHAVQIRDREARDILRALEGGYRFKRKFSKEKDTIAESYLDTHSSNGVCFLYGETKRFPAPPPDTGRLSLF